MTDYIKLPDIKFNNLEYGKDVVRINHDDNNTSVYYIFIKDHTKNVLKCKNQKIIVEHLMNDTNTELWLEAPQCFSSEELIMNFDNYVNEKTCSKIMDILKTKKCFDDKNILGKVHGWDIRYNILANYQTALYLDGELEKLSQECIQRAFIDVLPKEYKIQKTIVELKDLISELRRIYARIADEHIVNQIKKEKNKLILILIGKGHYRDNFDLHHGREKTKITHSFKEYGIDNNQCNDLLYLKKVDCSKLVNKKRKEVDSLQPVNKKRKEGGKKKQLFDFLDL